MRLYNLPGALGTLAFAFVALAQRPWEGDLPRAVTV